MPLTRAQAAQASSSGQGKRRVEAEQAQAPGRKRARGQAASKQLSLEEHTSLATSDPAGCAPRLAAFLAALHARSSTAAAAAGAPPAPPHRRGSSGAAAVLAALDALRVVAEAAPTQLLEQLLAEGARPSLADLVLLACDCDDQGDRVEALLIAAMGAAGPPLLERLLLALLPAIQLTQGGHNPLRYTASMLLFAASELPAGREVLLAHVPELLTGIARGKAGWSQMLQVQALQLLAEHSAAQLVSLDLSPLVKVLAVCDLPTAESAMEALFSVGQASVMHAGGASFIQTVLVPHLGQLVRMTGRHFSPAIASAAMHTLLLVAEEPGTGRPALRPHMKQLLRVMRQDERLDAALCAGEAVNVLLEDMRASAWARLYAPLLPLEQVDWLLAMVSGDRPTAALAADALLTVAECWPGHVDLASPERLGVLLAAMHDHSSDNAVAVNKALAATKAVLAITHASHSPNQPPPYLGQLVQVLPAWAAQGYGLGKMVAASLNNLCLGRPGQIALAPYLPHLQALLDHSRAGPHPFCPCCVANKAQLEGTLVALLCRTRFTLAALESQEVPQAALQLQAAAVNAGLAHAQLARACGARREARAAAAAAAAAAFNSSNSSGGGACRSGACECAATAAAGSAGGVTTRRQRRRLEAQQGARQGAAAAAPLAPGQAAAPLAPGQAAAALGVARARGALGCELLLLAQRVFHSECVQADLAAARAPPRHPVPQRLPLLPGQAEAAAAADAGGGGGQHGPGHAPPQQQGQQGQPPGAHAGAAE